MRVLEIKDKSLFLPLDFKNEGFSECAYKLSKSYYNTIDIQLMIPYGT